MVLLQIPLNSKEERDFHFLQDLRIHSNEGGNKDKDPDDEKPMFSFIGEVMTVSPKKYRGPVDTKVYLYASPEVCDNEDAFSAREHITDCFENATILCV